MATKQSTVDFILDQLISVKNISSRKMFGEYALYCNNKVVALICDDTLYVKITESGKNFVGPSYPEGAAYPKAKSSFKVENDHLDDHEWLCDLIRITEKALPPPKLKKLKK